MTRNSVANKQADAAMKSAGAASSQADTARRRQDLEEKYKETEVWGNAIGNAGKGIGGILRAVNDPEWYISDAFDSTAKQVNSISGTGRMLPVHGTVKMIHRPLFAVINYTPVLGVSSDQILGSDAINVSVNKLFNFTRYEAKYYTGTYDPVDQTQVIICLNSIYDAVEVGKREFRLAKKFSMYNQAFGDPMQKLATIPDIGNTSAQFRDKMNKFIEKLKAYPIPKFNHLGSRRYLLTHYVFADRESAKYGLPIKFMPTVSYRYNEALGKCEAIRFVTDSTSAYFNHLESLFRAIEESENAKDIIADLNNAFREIDTTPCELLEPFEDTSVEIFAYSSDIYKQLKNANMFRLPITSGTNTFLDIKQDNYNHLYQGVKLFTDPNDHLYGIEGYSYNTDQTWMNFAHVIDSKDDEITVGDLMESTRFMINVQQHIYSGDSSKFACCVIDSGTEIITSMDIYETAAGHEGGAVALTINGPERANQPYNPADYMDTVLGLKVQFHSLPRFLIEPEADEDDPAWMYLNETDHLFPLADSSFIELNNTALQCLYRVERPFNDQALRKSSVKMSSSKSSKGRTRNFKK